MFQAVLRRAGPEVEISLKCMQMHRKTHPAEEELSALG